MGKFDLPNLLELPTMNKTINKDVGGLRLCDLPPLEGDDYQTIFLNKQIEEDKEFRRKQAELKKYQVEKVEHSVW